MPVPARRRLDEFDLVAPTGADFLIGYRPGAKGIRFTVDTMVSGGLVINITSDQITDSTAAGRAMLTAPTVAAQKTLLSLQDYALLAGANFQALSLQGSVVWNAVTHPAHGNRASIDRITDGGGLPLWDGSAWPGGGGGAVAGRYLATWDGQGEVINDAVSVFIPVSAAQTIAEATLVADVAGTVTVTAKRYTPSGGVLGSATTLGTVSLSSAVHTRDITLAGWTKTLSAGDVVELVTSAAATIKRLTCLIA